MKEAEITGHRKKVTTEALLRFGAYFVENGYAVFIPLCEDTAIDLAVYKNGKFERIQIKATKPVKGKLIAPNRSSNNWQIKLYTTDDIDYLCIYDYENKKGYIIPEGSIEGKHTISLRVEKPKNNQKKNIIYAYKYEAF